MKLNQKFNFIDSEILLILRSVASKWKDPRQWMTEPPVRGGRRMAADRN